MTGAGPVSSLLGRVFRRMGITMFAAVLLVTAVLVLEFRAHVDTLRDRSLKGQVEDVARYLRATADGGVSVRLPPRLAAAYEASAKDDGYVVVAADGRILAGSSDLSAPLYDGGPGAASEIRYFRTLDPVTGRRFYGASLRRETAAGPVYVQVRQGAAHEDVVVDTFLDEVAGETLWAMLVVFGAILLVAFWALRGALRPLTEASARAAAIGPASLDRRLPMDGIPREIRPILAAVNAAFDRVEAGFVQQRRFVADAAHELRTPIAVLRAHVGSMDASVGRELDRDLASLERVVGQLLKLAQVDSLELAEGQRADLHTAAVNAAALMGPVAVAAGKRLAVTGADRAPVAGDEDALEVAVRNLIENALNQSAVGGEVEVEVTTEPALRVLDRGPGVRPEDRERIYERFWRSGRGQSDGAGLGLSIVARIAALHRARVHVEDRPGGGAVFVIAFPSAAEPPPPLLHRV